MVCDVVSPCVSDASTYASYDTYDTCVTVKTAVILAGGLGLRLWPLTLWTPKPLIEVYGKPILVWQIEWLRRHGVENFVLCVGHLWEKIMGRLKDGGELGVSIRYSIEEKPLGTGGAIKRALNLFDDEIFYVVNGDIITFLNPVKLVEALVKHENAVLSMALVPMRCPYGVVELDGDIVKGFKEKPVIEEVLINGGVYAMRREIACYLPDEGDIEKTAFPRLAEEGKIVGVRYVGVVWRSIDTHKDLREAEEILRSVC